MIRCPLTGVRGSRMIGVASSIIFYHRHLLLDKGGRSLISSFILINLRTPVYHPLSFFSAIYFFKNPENAGKTIFKSYEEPNMLPLKNLKRNDLSQSNCHYIPRERTLLIFKSNLLHMVSQSQSDEPRITASFNLV